MVLTATKLIKVSIPIVSSIVGVFVTSSLVSKNAEDKEKEKPLTKLKDKDPIIEDYEDANEGDCKKEAGKDCKGGSQGPKGEKGEGGSSGGGGKQGKQGESGGGSGGTSSNVDQVDQSLQDSRGDSDKDSEQPSSQKEPPSSPEESDDDDSESSADDSEEGKDRITNNGSAEAEHNNALGTKFGSEDRRMTTQEIDSLKDTRSSLTNVLSELSAMFKGV